MKHLILVSLFSFLALMSSSGQEPAPLKFFKWSGDLNVPDPVAIAFDDTGNAYVTQTQRRKIQDLDIRQHQEWIPADVALQSVAEKRAFLRKTLAPNAPGVANHIKDLNKDGLLDYRDLMVLSERIYKISDTDGDGTADTKITFAEDFQTEVTGIAAGVLWHEGNVYSTIAPDVWRLTDEDNDGVADSREAISTGYGLHIAYAGHDMSGLTVGPDGRIYWSIGDKGVSVTDKNGKRWHYPNQGAVMRSEPDGSNFEVFAHGLRNAQELAFDEYGNLFSVDNDADQPGEKERFIYIVDNMDAGWRCNYQYRKGSYNPWVDEGLWKPHFEGRPAYALAPICNYHDGPCGFVYNPGTALGKGWEKTFFMTGAPRGFQWAFQIESDGASFKMVNSRSIGKGTALIGWNFAPDGALYAVDWAGGYPLNQTGAIWKLDVPEAQSNPKRTKTMKLIATDFSTLTTEKLEQLLEHDDQRVRLIAQLELVNQNEMERLYTIASQPDNHELKRIHAIWGLGQLTRKGKFTGAEIAELLNVAKVTEIRSQLYRIASDATEFPASALRKGLQANSREKYFALIAAKEHASQENLPLISNIIKSGETKKDHYLRHAAVEALTAFTPAELVKLNSEDVETQLCAVIALRRLQHPDAARFLDSKHTEVSTEAALAIHDDFSIVPALPPLAQSLLTSKNTTDQFVLRAINANARLGTAESAGRVVKFSVRESASESQRLFAIDRLTEWLNPAMLDSVTGRARTVPEKIPVATLSKAIEPFVDTLLDSQSSKVQAAAMHMCRQYNLNPAIDVLTKIIKNPQADTSVRVAALQVLEGKEDAVLPALNAAIESKVSQLRLAALNRLTDVDPKTALSAANRMLKAKSLPERQASIAALGKLKDKATIEGLTKKLIAGDLEKGLQLEVIEAATALNIQGEFTKFNAGRTSMVDPASFQECLQGGDKEKGKDIYYNHLAAQCVRCHKNQAKGPGSIIGPNLYNAGSKSREYLLEALVAPQATMAKGYGTISITRKDGEVVSGLFQNENKKVVRIKDATSGLVTEIPLDDIESRTPMISVMPPMGALLKRSELRDLIAYLANLNG